MFVIAAILAPPDVITQCGLALPLIALYEISIIAARMVEPKPKCRLGAGGHQMLSCRAMPTRQA